MNLDYTGHCPLGHRCESCGAEVPGLTVKAATTPLGVLCMTMCPPCVAAALPPPVTVSTAARLVLEHCIHLRITADQMDAELRRRPWPS